MKHRIALLLAIIFASGSAFAGTAAEAVRARLDAWLAAQNSGDAAAYTALYARKFTGVKRAGLRTSRFDRAGWIADRVRMFKRPMKVGAQDVGIGVSGATARVRFVQSWQSGSFADVGPKEQIWVREGKAWNIAREEMLRSDVGVAAPSAPASGASGFMVDGYYVLESDTKLEPERPLATLAHGDVDTVARAVDASQLAPEFRRLQGAALAGYAIDGKACAGRITGFAVIAALIPHFGQSQEWAALPSAQVANEAWESGKKLLVATTTGCPQARFAVVGAAPGPPVAAPDPPSADERKQALAALHATPQYKELQTAFLRDDPKSKSGWESGEGGSLKVEVYRGSQTLISVTAIRDADGCDGFSANLWQLFEAKGSNLVAVSAALPVVPAFALRNGGHLQIIHTDGRWGFGHLAGRIAPRQGLYDKDGELVVPYYDCPC